MTEHLTTLGEGFHHIRGTLRLAGMVDIGTHCSLARLPDGDFVFLDSYTLPPAIMAQVVRMTDGGKRVRAILNLHPFHTLHCEWMHRAFPAADLYGTQRHHDQLPDLPWQTELCESEALHRRFGEAFDFSVPQGTALVCESDTVHFASILALHRASGVIHVDDTLSCAELPFPLSLLPMAGRLDFHPTLAKALEPRAGAADAFREWAIGLGVDWNHASHLAMAHNVTLPLPGDRFAELIGAALGRVKPVLDAHRAQHG